MATSPSGVPEEVLLNTELHKDLVEEAKDFALQNGVLIRTKETPNSSEGKSVVTYAPFTLFPSPVPKDTFHQPLAVQTHYNRLVDRISQPMYFNSTIKVDDFTGSLFNIHRHGIQEGRTQVVLDLNRSDNMLDQNSSLKQIEINTYIFQNKAYYYFIIRHILKRPGQLDESKHVLDDNPSASFHITSNVNDSCSNCIFGHRYIENELWNRRFDDVSKMGFLDGNEQVKLILSAEMEEVAIVYFRYRCIPQNYTEQSWEARLMMERSLAVKCPDISTHLVGKKIQQELARPGVLERFFPGEPDVVDQIRATFAGLYTLDMKVTRLSMAFAKPDQFVLKPQRESGRAAYVWMDKIQPVHNYILERGTLLKLSTCICELGTFGAYVMSSHIVLRTKSDERSDGGVAAGVTVQDNPLFV
uniref:Glutathione synthetase n=1 Tax=Oncorhynchus tshawytscha TaxID=74940 RepID=A0A8C8F119_ONCTS